MNGCCLVSCFLPMPPDLRHVLMHGGAEAAQPNQRLAAGVDDLDAGGGRVVGNEDFVPRLFAEMDHHRRLDASLPIRPQPCTVIQPLAPGSFNTHFAPGITVSSLAETNCSPSKRP